MALKKVLFFIAGSNPTVDESAELAALQDGQYEVLVRNASAAMNFGPRLEACDFVAGSVPESYSESPVWNPAGDLPSNQVAVTDGDELAEAGGGTISVTVVDGEATYTYTAAQ